MEKYDEPKMQFLIRIYENINVRYSIEFHRYFLYICVYKWRVTVGYFWWDYKFDFFKIVRRVM